MGFVVFFVFAFVCVVNERWVVAYSIKHLYMEGWRVLGGCGDSTVNSCQLADMRLWAYKAFQDSPQKISKIKIKN